MNRAPISPIRPAKKEPRANSFTRSRHSLSLYFIGVAMGIADLIPGVSGGTIAFISGIYEELLESIKTLQLQSIRKIAWSFLLPVGAGVFTAVFLASRLLYYLLFNYPTPLFAFFWGVILASAFFCWQKAGLRKPQHWTLLAFGALVAFSIVGMQQSQISDVPSFFWIALAGMAAAGAMLLPGISGSYLLQLLGIYSLVLRALNAPAEPGSFKVLMAIGLGASLGFVFFSRIVSWLMARVSTWMSAILVGFMLGGTRAIWPFCNDNFHLSILFAIFGFFLVILLEMRMKKSREISRV